MGGIGKQGGIRSTVIKTYKHDEIIGWGGGDEEKGN